MASDISGEILENVSQPSVYNPGYTGLRLRIGSTSAMFVQSRDDVERTHHVSRDILKCRFLSDFPP